jgi:DNA-binding beta-propeller fold protein YncE
VTLFLVSFFAYSLVKWFYERSFRLSGQFSETETGIFGLALATLMGLLMALFLFAIGVVLWFVFIRKYVKRTAETDSLGSLFHAEQLLGFMPYLIWWLLLTWAAYSWAGEKMPWLSAHFVIPMALMSGWYFNEKLKRFGRADLFSKTALLYGGLTALLLILLFSIFGLFWLGKLQLGSQQIDALQNVGLFIGLMGITAVLAYFWWQQRKKMERPLRGTWLILSIFLLLSLLTIRATYMSSFTNADYTTEFMVYAHGAPATKAIVMDQIETLSMRLYGDKSIKVAYDNDVSWPFTWYLRDYPNRVYFGENPTNSLNDSPIIVVGNLNWGKVEPFLGDNYEENAYTFLWWPMEEYRNIGWDSVFGNPLDLEDRGLADPGIRKALWDIFFYRDYQQYGEAFGGIYTAREWPLRHELKVYTRKDVLASLWDQGVAPTNIEAVSDPYAEGELLLQPSLVLNEFNLPGNADGQFSFPRNVAVGPDGDIFVADSGNHRIQVFDPQGNFVTTWGEFGEAPGQFNEPWGIAVDDRFVYVADTWNYRIQKFTYDGRLLGVFGQNGSPFEDDPGLGLFYGPRDIALVDDGRLAITDTGNHRLQLMDRDGNFLDSAGGPGSLPGQFNEPVGLTTGANGNVYVADTWNGRIQELTPDLLPVYDWPVDGWYSQSVDNKPYIATDSANRIYVTDPEGFRVLVFDQDGSYLARFGVYGTEANQFALPVGIAIDAQDNIYVADANNNRIVKYPAIFGPPAASTPDEDAPLFEGMESEDRTLSDPEEGNSNEAVEEESAPTETAVPEE